MCIRSLEFVPLYETTPELRAYAQPHEALRETMAAPTCSPSNHFPSLSNRSLACSSALYRSDSNVPPGGRPRNFSSAGTAARVRSRWGRHVPVAPPS